ncbi:MAG: response regulator [Haloarculaceae archaeon]
MDPDPTPDPASVVGEFRRPRVLVVDGDDARTERYAVWLAGHEVTRAHRGDEALDRLREVDADAVVVSRRLPDMSGAAVVSSIRDRDLDVRVALICGPDESPPVMSAEVDAILQPPRTPADLAGAVTDLLTRRNRQQLWLELSSKRVRRNVRSVERRAHVDLPDVDLPEDATRIESRLHDPPSLVDGPSP